MNTSYIIMGVFVVLSVLYLIIGLPLMMKRAKKKQAGFMDNIKGREGEVRQEYLNDPQFFKPISDKLVGEKIIGIVSCMEKRNVGNVAKDAAVNMAGKVAGRAFGVGFKTTDNQDLYFVALTDQNLHYLVYDYEEGCEEHLIYQLSNMEDLKLDKAKFQDNYTGGSSGGEKLTFKNKGKKEAFFLYPMCMGFPGSNNDVGGMGGWNEKAVYATELINKPLMEALRKQV